MQLIGMLDSPYVRRVAISLQRLQVPFTHRSISVFRHMDEMRRINPVIKVPALVCDDGEVLVDSTLILEYAEALSGRSLMPTALPQRQHALRLIGLALVACEKSVQMLYEQITRPPEKRHDAWLARVTEQAVTAYALLEAELARRPPSAGPDIGQAAITTAVAWDFTQHHFADVVPATAHPHLAALSAQAETLPAFKAAPFGEGTYVAT